MLPEFKRKTNIGVGVGFVAQLAGRSLVESGQASVGWLVILAALGFFIWGCAQYAQAKGHTPWFGALGLFSIFGLIVLVFLPDRHKNAQA